MQGILNLFDFQDIAAHLLLPFALCANGESPSFPGSSYAFGWKPRLGQTRINRKSLGIDFAVATSRWTGLNDEVRANPKPNHLPTKTLKLMLFIFGG